MWEADGGLPSSCLFTEYFRNFTVFFGSVSTFIKKAVMDVSVLFWLCLGLLELWAWLPSMPSCRGLQYMLGPLFCVPLACWP